MSDYEGGANQEAKVPGAPLWLSATEDDFKCTDLELPIADSNSVDCSDLYSLFEQAVKEATSTGQESKQRVYGVLAALCSFYFKPEEPNEPFGPFFQSGTQRSAIPEDFRGDLERVLGRHAEAFRNAAIRARVNDILWILDKSRANAARIALEGYVQSVRAYIEVTQNDDPSFVAEHLRV